MRNGVDETDDDEGEEDVKAKDGTADNGEGQDEDEDVDEDEEDDEEEDDEEDDESDEETAWFDAKEEAVENEGED